MSATIATVVLSGFSQVSLSFESAEHRKNIFSPLSSIEFSSAAAQAQTAASSDWSSLEQAVLAEHNRVRQNPQSYIPILEAHLSSMTADGHIIHGCGQNCVLTTREGRTAVREAIAFLRRQPAVGALGASVPAARAAKSHAQDQRGGATGHVSSNGASFVQRLNRFGLQDVGMGENIAYGVQSAEQVVMNLIVDDGVPSRGHRTNIFAQNWSLAGTGCGGHATYGTVCVVNYAAR